MARPAFATRVLAWAREHGRRDLPWQRRPTLYRVWVSEIMLQQTQVTTVIPYYRRFIKRFPGVRALAEAHVDDVLALWSGLGYYARGRNLHRAAKVVVDRHGGRFPRDVETLASLPGIGRSTAAAIASLALDEPHAILDGNVKRVLARHAGIDGWPGESQVARALWDVAETRLPGSDGAAYTQAMMDLGATLCRGREPDCGACPVAGDCVARREGRTGDLPGRKPKRTLPRKRTIFLLLEDERGAFLLERRPPAGIWGGLWCFPECPDSRAVASRLADLGLEARGRRRKLPVVEHGFSHYRLSISPVRVPVAAMADRVAAAQHLRWETPEGAAPLALAAPVARLVASLAGGK